MSNPVKKPELLEKYIIGFDFSNKVKPILVIVEHVEGEGVRPVNAITGGEVLDLYKKLINKEPNHE